MSYSDYFNNRKTWKKAILHVPLPFSVNGHEVIKLLDFVATIYWYISSQIKEQSYHCQWLCHHKSTLVGRNCLFIFSENIDYYQTQGPLHNGSFIFLREFLKKLCYTLTTNLTGLIETKSSGSDYISLYHVQSTLISKSKFHRLVSKTD